MISVPPPFLDNAARLLRRRPLRRPTAAFLELLTRFPTRPSSVDSSADREPELDAAIDPHVSAYVMRFDAGPVDETSLLKGATFVVKDSIDVEGEPTSLGMRDPGERAERDAVLVARVRRAGGLLLGKTKMTELGMDGVGASIYGAVPPNPKSPGYFAGGSSTGTAIAVASGEARFGIGGDGMGSVRIPSAFCGLVGLKPTHFGLPHEGYRSPAPSMDVPGPMTRNVADCVLLYQILAGLAPEPLTPYVPRRIGVLRELGPELSSRSIARAFHRVLALLGTEVHRVSAPLARNATVLGTNIGMGEIARSEHVARELSAAGRLNVSLGLTWGPDDIARLDAMRARLRDQVMRALDETPILAMPTTAVPAPAIRRSLIDGSQDVQLLLAVGAYTPLANLTGLPAISVPAGVDSRGRSLGIMFMGRPDSEIDLLRLAMAVEATRVADLLA